MESQQNNIQSSQKMTDNLSFDVIIIGAGISGINSAYRIQTDGPSDLSYAILEGRDSLGGTWDLFKYPGIRSDSDIFTFGFPWSPWKHKESLAAGDKIKSYMVESARSTGIESHICYGHSVLEANWRSDKQRWELQVRRTGEEQPVTFTCRFVLLGTGYYDYEVPLHTVIPGIDDFQGKVIHPQFWPQDYDYTNKNVVVIGSGATAVTIVPSMADKAKRVTMLQRSPGYIFPLPSHSVLGTLLFTLLPANLAYFFNRLLWLVKSYLTTLFCKSCPGLAKKIIRKVTVSQLPPDVKWDPHFKPRYNPWDQRFCASLNGDFFAAIRSGKADIVTDKIKTVTKESIELESGEVLRPDAIVTATGLKLRFGGGIKLAIDGKAFNVADKYAWRTLMLQDTPNMFFIFGYENASWTLGADVSAQLFVRILNRMRDRNQTVAVPRLDSSRDTPVKPMMSLSSTYLKNAGAVLPKAGVGSWGAKSNYFRDMAGAKWGDIATDLEYS
ncbi:flavin-binding monooxygenase-like domain-containing protein [Sarocladium implicatum]|nr:flavin-binding monooxygenase-like domain-containing protein [Sarocladium implicatum]